MSETIRTTCEVHLRVKVNVGGTWDTTTTIAQAQKDAKQQARNHLMQICGGKVEFIGEPEIKVLIVDPKS